MTATALPRRSRRETRELLLLAGVLLTDDLAAGQEASHLARWLAHVRIERVLPVAKQLQLYLAEHAPDRDIGGLGPAWLLEHGPRILDQDVSTYRDIAKPTAYTVFDSEEDYRGRLAERLLTRERVNDAAVLLGAIDQLFEEFDGPPPLSTYISRLADLEFDRVRDLPSSFVEMGTAPFLGDPTIRRLMRRSREATAYGEGGLISLYELLLDTYDLRMRHGATTEDLYVALTSLFHGMCFHDRVWPESVRSRIPFGPGVERSVIAVAAEGIIRGFTEPAPGA